MEYVSITKHKNLMAQAAMLLARRGVRFVRYSYNGMAYGVRVAETGLEQNRMRLICVLNYYRLYRDRSIKQLGLQDTMSK